MVSPVPAAGRGPVAACMRRHFVHLPAQPSLRFPLHTLPRLTEGHRQPLYCGAFNHIAHQLGDLLATVGGYRVRSACCCYCNATSAQLGDTPLASIMLAG